MDEHLIWSKHISLIQNLIAKNIGIILRIRPFINTKTALLLYLSLIYPYLTYCNIVWASTYHSHLHRLNVLQKRNIRIVFLLPFLSSTKSTFVNNNLLSIYQIHCLQVALFTFCYDYNALPKIFTGFFTVIVTITLPTSFILHMNIVLHLLSLPSNSFPFNAMVQDYILQFHYQ